MARKSPKKDNPRFHNKSVGDYATGYGKPPVATRFKPGASPNPNGRPKGSKNKTPPLNEFAKMLIEEGMLPLDLNDGRSGKKTITTSRAIARSTNRSAVNGNVRAQKLSMEMLHKAQNELRAQKDKLFTAAFEYKKWWREDCAQRKRDGVPDPLIYPHPDDLLLNFETGEVTIAALTADEVTRMRLLIEAKKFYETSVLDLLTEDIGSADAAIIWHELKFCVDMLRIIHRGLDLEWADNFTKPPDFERIRALAKKMKKDAPPQER